MTSTSTLRLDSILAMLRPKRSGVPMLRLGTPDSDGGYLVPDDLSGISAVFSPGVAKDSSFESHFAQLGIPCWMIDGSVTAPPIENDKFHFQSKWLRGSSDGSTDLSMVDWIDESGIDKDSDAILQMDIEGSEWEVLLSTPLDVLSRFRIIVIELHGLEAIATRFGADIVEGALRKLTSNHDVVHFHINNCCKPHKLQGRVIPQVVELTLIRKDRSQLKGGWATLPHELDSPNVPGREYVMHWK